LCTLWDEYTKEAKRLVRNLYPKPGFSGTIKRLIKELTHEF